MQKDLVTIKSFSSNLEAEIAKGKLEVSGIKSLIVKDDCGGAYPIMQSIHGVKLKVCESDTNLAQKILEPETSEKQGLKYSKQENTIAVWSLSSWLLYTAAFGFIIAGFSVSRILIIIGIILMFAGMIFGFFTRRKKKELNSVT